MENISRGLPSGILFTIPHRGVDAGQHDCKTTGTRVQTPLSPLCQMYITGGHWAAQYLFEVGNSQCRIFFFLSAQAQKNQKPQRINRKYCTDFISYVSWPSPFNVGFFYGEHAVCAGREAGALRVRNPAIYIQFSLSFSIFKRTESRGICAVGGGNSLNFPL